MPAVQVAVQVTFVLGNKEHVLVIYLCLISL